MRDYAYASYGDIQAHLSFIPTFTPSTKPNATQVHSHLVDSSNLLDAALALADYSTPVPTVATHALELVRSWTAIGAAHKTALAMPGGSDSKHAEALGKDWDVILQQVRDGELGLPDLDKQSGTSLARAGGDVAGAGPSPTFTRDYIER